MTPEDVVARRASSCSGRGLVDEQRQACRVLKLCLDPVFIDRLEGITESATRSEILERRVLDRLQS
jgi:hypothetical protein